MGKSGGKIIFSLKIRENLGILDSAWSLSCLCRISAIIYTYLELSFCQNLVYIVHRLRKISEIREFSCKFGLKNQGKSGNLFVKSCVSLIFLLANTGIDFFYFFSGGIFLSYFEFMLMMKDEDVT